MSNITMTPEAFLQYLKRNVLGDVDFDRIAGMNDDDKQQLMLRQIDNMIGMQPGADALGWYFTKFLDDDGRCQADNPLTDEASTPLSEWLYDMAELGRLLYWHQAFPLELLEPELEYDPFVDEKLNFTIDNEQLVSWLKVVPYRRVAAMVARIMMSAEYDRIQGCNDAMQDYLKIQLNSNSSREGKRNKRRHGSHEQVNGVMRPYAKRGKGGIGGNKYAGSFNRKKRRRR